MKALLYRLPLLGIVVLCSCHRTTPENDLVLIQIQDRNGLSETISKPERLCSYEEVDFLSAQPYKRVLRVYRTEGKNSSVLTTYHPNGGIWQLLEAKEMRAFGAFREWFPNGLQKIEATVIGGRADLSPEAQGSWLFDGVSRVWDEEGRLHALLCYEKGVLFGLSSYFYLNGKLEKEIPYIQDRIEGEVREFWENGELRATIPFSRGVKEGKSFGFWENGSPRWEEVYSCGLLKEAMYWSFSNEVVAEVREGSGFQAVFEGKNLAQLREIQDGVVEGMVKVFRASGELSSLYHVKDGLKHGEEIEYYQQGPKISFQWDRNILHGPVKTWYEDGQLQSQRELSHNKRNGASCAWYRNGAIMFVEEYENDLLIQGQYYRKNQPQPVSKISNGNGAASLYDEEGGFLRKVPYCKGKPVDLD